MCGAARDMSTKKGRKRTYTSELLTHQQGDVLKVGFLRKKGHVRRNWLDRWFVLTTEGVYYYKNRTVRLLKSGLHSVDLHKSRHNFLITGSNSKSLASCIHVAPLQCHSFDIHVHKSSVGPKDKKL